MAAAINPRLEAALRNQHEAEEQAQKHAQKVQDILVQECAATDKELLGIQKKLRSAKDKQHRHRLVMARKRFAVRIREKQIAIIREELSKMESADQTMCQQVGSLEGDCEKVRDKIATRVRKEMQKQPAVDKQ